MVSSPFVKKTPSPFAIITEAVGGQGDISFYKGQPIALDEKASDWPELIKNWMEAPRADGTYLAVPLDAAPGWCKHVRVIDPATFRTQDPPPTPRTVFLTEEEVKARYGVTPVDVADLGFPVRSLTRFVEENRSVRTVPLWDAGKVATWAKKLKAGASRG